MKFLIVKCSSLPIFILLRPKYFLQDPVFKILEIDYNYTGAFLSTLVKHFKFTCIFFHYLEDEVRILPPVSCHFLYIFPSQVFHTIFGFSILDHSAEIISQPSSQICCTLPFMGVHSHISFRGYFLRFCLQSYLSRLFIQCFVPVGYFRAFNQNNTVSSF